MSEFEIKQDRIRNLLQQHQAGCLVLRRVSSFAWATCGAPSYVGIASSDGIATLVITPSRRCDCSARSVTPTATPAVWSMPSAKKRSGRKTSKRPSRPSTAGTGKRD